MAYGDLNYTTDEINADLAKVHDKEALVEEAPSDGKQYGRKNNGWAVVEAGGTEHTLDLSPLFDEGGSPVATVSDEFLTELQKAYDEKYSNATGIYGLNGILPLAINKEADNYTLISSLNNTMMGIAQIGIFSYTINEQSKSLTENKAAVMLQQSGSGTKALTDNGQYADFAKPTKVVTGSSGTVTQQLSPNTLYKFGECSSLTITLGAETSGIVNEYMFEFVSGSTATTLSVPETVKWSGGSAPTIEANKTYQVSIVNNLAVYAAF